MMRKTRVVAACLAGAAALAVGAGCGGSEPATTAGGGGVTTSASAAGAETTVTVALTDGTTAVVAAYFPEVGGKPTAVRAKVGDLIALQLPQAFTGETWTADGGTADGTIAELVGQGTAVLPAANSGGSDQELPTFTYRATAAGSGTLAFRAAKAPPEDGSAPEPELVYRYALKVS